VKYKNETNLSIRIPVAREFPPLSNMLAGIFFVNLALKTREAEMKFFISEKLYCIIQMVKY